MIGIVLQGGETWPQLDGSLKRLINKPAWLATVDFLQPPQCEMHARGILKMFDEERRIGNQNFLSIGQSTLRAQSVKLRAHMSRFPLAPGPEAWATAVLSPGSAQSLCVDGFHCSAKSISTGSFADLGVFAVLLAVGRAMLFLGIVRAALSLAAKRPANVMPSLLQARPPGLTPPLLSLRFSVTANGPS